MKPVIKHLLLIAVFGLSVYGVYKVGEIRRAQQQRELQMANQRVYNHWKSLPFEAISSTPQFINALKEKCWIRTETNELLSIEQKQSLQIAVADFFLCFHETPSSIISNSGIGCHVY
jgi:hypothetical protein